MATQLGTAKKTFGELTLIDLVHYIDPKDPTVLKALTIKSVKPWELKKGYVEVEYYQSSEALAVVTMEKEDLVPTRLIRCEAKATRILSATLPPAIYFSNKKDAENFMAGK